MRGAAGAIRRALGLSVLCAPLFAAAPASAYFERLEVGARAIAMGGAFAAVADDASAVYWNPAGLPSVREPRLLLMHYRPFVVEGLSTNFGALVVPIGESAVWSAWSHTGLSGVVSEDMVYLGAGRRFDPMVGPSFSLGVSAKLARVAFERQFESDADGPVDFGSQTRLAGDFGLTVRLTERLAAGYVVRNVGAPLFDFVPGNGGTRLSTVEEGGLAFRWNPASTVAAAVVRGAEGDPVPAVGAEILFFDVFALRAGAADFEFYGGVGIQSNGWYVDTAVLTHKTLGISYMVSIEVPLRRRPE